jgi:hypothetical protein
MWRVEALPLTAARGQGGANKLHYDRKNKRVFCNPKMFNYTCTQNSAGILEQSMGARNRVGIGLSSWPASLHIGRRIYSMELISGLLQSLKIRARKHFLSYLPLLRNRYSYTGLFLSGLVYCYYLLIRK